MLRLLLREIPNPTSISAAVKGNSTGLALQTLPCAFGGYACRNLPAATQPHTFATNIEPDTRVRTYGFSARGKLDISGLGTLSTFTAYNNSKAYLANGAAAVR